MKFSINFIFITLLLSIGSLSAETLEQIVREATKTIQSLEVGDVDYSCLKKPKYKKDRTTSQEDPGYMMSLKNYPRPARGCLPVQYVTLQNAKDEEFDLVADTQNLDDEQIQVSDVDMDGVEELATEDLKSDEPEITKK